MHKLKLLSVLILLAVYSPASGQSLNSSVYDWEKLAVKKTANGELRDILKSPARSLDMFDIKAITLNTGQSVKDYKVENGFDELLIIKEGSAEITVNSESKILGAGSVVVAAQGDKVKIRNLHNTNTTFYSFLFKPKNSESSLKPEKKFPPLLADWNALVFKPGPNGGRRDIMKQPTSLLRELEMHTTTLNEGLPSHAAHTHPDEEIILVRFGFVQQTINGIPYTLGPGSVIFLSNDDNHGISNAGKGKCEYYAIRWLTYADEKK
jgi:mannose-6-phosphate isomerase-like protein (cupin superfamily)